MKSEPEEGSPKSEMQVIKSYLLCLLVVVVALSTGCQGQSFKQAMEIICDPTAYITNLPDEPAARATAIAEVVNREVTNEEVLTMMASLAALPPAERRQRVEDAVARARLPSCRLLDEL